MPTPLPTIPNLKASYGPMLIGVFFNMILYGILCMQMLTYFTTYRGDRLAMKLFVGFLFFVETCNTAFDMHFMYQPLIQRFGTLEAIKFFPTMFVTEPLCIAAVSTPIQFFFAWRILKITKSYWIPVIIAVLGVTSLGGAIWTSVIMVHIKLFARKEEMHWSALTWFLSSCVADVLITGTLVRSLSQRKTGFVATDTVIDKIIRMTVQTGAITAIFAVGDVIFFMTIKGAYNFVWDLCLAKLYCNCLMSTLNARQSLNDVTNAPSQANRNAMLESGQHGRRHMSSHHTLSTVIHSVGHPTESEAADVVHLHIDTKLPKFPSNPSAPSPSSLPSASSYQPLIRNHQDTSFMEGGHPSIHYPSSPGAYELDSKSFDTGVRVTKIVERLEDSPSRWEK